MLTVWTYNARDQEGAPTYGGYSDRIVVDENYVLRMPDNLPLDACAPLLCAGITLYSPLRHWKAGPGKKVAIVGLGGLGHMGVKLAHALGAEVTVLSQSLKKQADGKRLGADHFYATSDPETFTKLARFLRPDHQHGLGKDGLESIPVPVEGRRNHGGGGPSGERHPDRSVFADCRPAQSRRLADRRHSRDAGDAGFLRPARLACDIEVVPIQKVNEAYERVLKSDVRYRFVIDMASLSQD